MKPKPNPFLAPGSIPKIGLFEGTGGWNLIPKGLDFVLIYRLMTTKFFSWSKDLLIFVICSFMALKIVNDAKDHCAFIKKIILV